MSRPTEAFIIAGKANSAFAVAARPFHGKTSMCPMEGDGWPAFLFFDRTAAELALDGLPHGDAKNARILKIDLPE